MAHGRAARMEGSESFSATNADLAAECIARQTRCGIDDRVVSCGISIFRELGFARVAGFGRSRRVSMEVSPARMDLARSIRYLEGQRACEEFATYRDWALEAPASSVLERVRRPIVP